ncbi:ABC transporter permease [Amycolatopsis sp. FU40]|uniref:ABC transporter permease n=1 Tax=Amycolatopsis sp. FU40 TaxID=2914159 RepID=UPI001F275C64|nr:ABC transporter permease [Amycolatopsis sp. FU40]UKD57043.1 ABC transporter permease [Amycolatopsis sp. FU40]
MHTSELTPAPAPPLARRRSRFAQRELGLAGVLVALVAGFSVLAPRFASAGTLSQVLADMAIVVIVATGQALVLFTRNIDVSVGSTVGLTAYAAAAVIAAHPGLPLVVPILVAMLLGLALGAINGALVATLKVPSIMVTLGTLYVFRGADSALAGSQQITAQNMPSSYTALASWSIAGIPGMFVYAAVIAVIAHLVVRHTLTGRALLATGSGPESAERMGVRSGKLVFGAYAVTGLLCGIAGVLWGARYGTVDSSAANGYELVILAAVVIGGVSITGGAGSVPGVVLGAAVLSVIGIGLALLDVSPFWLQAVQGFVIIVAITLDLVLRRRLASRRRTA